MNTLVKNNKLRKLERYTGCFVLMYREIRLLSFLSCEPAYELVLMKDVVSLVPMSIRLD